jgi:predicted O-methyltransferase YrrM
MRVSAKAYLVAAVLALTAAPSAALTQPAKAPPDRGPDVIYVPTPHETVDAMLKMGEVKAGDVLYDLGSGDGRIPIAAAKQFGVKGVGIDIDPNRIKEANANAEAAGVSHLVSFRQEDLFEADFSEATVITLYLLPSLNEKLMPRLLKLKPGTRIVSHAFLMGDWQPEQQQMMPSGNGIYRWTVPAKAATPTQ